MVTIYFTQKWQLQYHGQSYTLTTLDGRAVTSGTAEGPTSGGQPAQSLFTVTNVTASVQILYYLSLAVEIDVPTEGLCLIYVF